MKHKEEIKKAFFIRKVEELFLNLFREGKISGTVHTCVGQEYTGVFAAKHANKNDFVVSNHRGHGHYISFTNDYFGLIAELLGNENGCSGGIGGSQHLFNDNFMSNGIQGGMLPIASGVSFSNKLKNNNNISIAFLGDGTLGEGLVYETLNLVSLWQIPIIFILEKNNISQSTSFQQNFAGNIEKIIAGFGVKYFKASIYDLDELDLNFEKAFNFCRNNKIPVFIEVEVARLNAHSKGDDNRSEILVNDFKKKDPINILSNSHKSHFIEWEKEVDDIILHATSEFKVSEITNLAKSPNKSSNYLNSFVNQRNDSSSKRFNELIYDELFSILNSNENSILIGEDIENNNQFNPGQYGGAFKVTRDLSNIFRNRVLNTPISEQAITGISIGLALNGHISILEIMFGDFTTLVFDQILQHVSKFTSMYGRNLNIPFILRTPMGAFKGYGPTHSQSLEKHFLGIHGLRVVALNQFLEPSIIYNKAINNKEPIIIIENKTLYTKFLHEGLIDGYTNEILNLDNSYPIIRLKPKNIKADITIVCYGGILDEVLKAGKMLIIENEIFVEIFIISDLTNSEIPFLNESLSTTNKLCIVEEGNSFAALSSEIITNLLENHTSDFKVLRISNNNLIPSSRNMELKCLPTSTLIKNKIKLFV
jgi:2-oxoisovalerate dehydrogenase E1 component